MQFLSCPSALSQHENDHFTMPTRLNIQKKQLAKHIGIVMLTFIPRYDSNNEDVCKGIFLKYGPPYFQLAKGEQSLGILIRVLLRLFPS